MIASDQPRIFDESRVKVRVSSRGDGTMKSNGAGDIEEVTANMKAFASQAGLAFDRLVAMNVGAHADVWDEIVTVTEPAGRPLIAIEDRLIADALVTTRRDVVLVLPVADCNAVAIHDPVKEVLAVVHLGWQSTVADLASKIVSHLHAQYMSQPSDLRVYISPSIRAESYVFDKVSQQDDARWRPFLHKTDAGVGIDLPGYNRQLCIEAGVLPEHIQLTPVNTAASEDYFSHYRAVRSGEPDGRFALFAALQ